MAKQTPSETYGFSPKSGAASPARGLLGFALSRRFDSATTVMVVVSLVTAYLVLPPLYSVIQTSLFTTKLTGEIDSLPFVIIVTS